MRKPGMASVAQGLAAEATASRERVGRPGKRQAAALGLMVGERDAGAPPSSGASGAAGGRQGPATDEAATAPSALTGGGCSWEVMYAALRLDQGKALGVRLPYTLPSQWGV